MDSPPVVNGAAPPPKHSISGTPWFHRLSHPVLFLTISLALVGGYLAFSIPISVFPNTDFPRIVIGADNGVMPIDQMMVTVTRLLEEAVNGIPGIERVQSMTSRGQAEINLYFEWETDMNQALDRINAALARAQPNLPSTLKLTSQRLTF